MSEIFMTVSYGLLEFTYICFIFATLLSEGSRQNKNKREEHASKYLGLKGI